MIECLLLLVALLRVAVRSRADVMAENLLLRHQPAVLTRPTRRRPRLRARAGPIRSRPVLGGLHHAYERTA